MKKPLKENKVEHVLNSDQDLRNATDELKPLFFGKNLEKMSEIQLGIEDYRERSKEFIEIPKNPKWGSPCMVQTGESYMCKLCGRGFKSPRAVFGHLRCHSKRKAEAVRKEVNKFNVPRKKRSIGRYKIHTSSSNNSSWSNMNASSSVTNVVDDEMLDVVASLLFLANGCGDGFCNSVDHVSDDCESVEMAPKFVIYSDVQVPKVVENSYVLRGLCDSLKDNIGEFHGSFSELSNCEADKFKAVSYIKFLPELYDVKVKGEDVGVLSADTSFTPLNPCTTARANCYEKVDVVDQVFDGSTSGICDVTLVINGCYSDTGPVVNIEHEVKLNESGIKYGSRALYQADTVGENYSSNSFGLDINELKNSSLDATDKQFDMCNSVTSAPTIASTCVYERRKCTGSLCNKTFSTNPALGGHRLLCKSQAKKKARNYKCMVCSRTFPSGHALGGHKRAHFKTKVESNNKVQNFACDKESVVTNKEKKSVEDVAVGDDTSPAVVIE